MSNQPKKKARKANEIEVALLPVPNVIVLPKTSISFYLQDERYIQMMREVVSNNAMVALAMTDAAKDAQGNIIPQTLLPRAVSVLVYPTLMEDEPHGLHHGGMIMRGVCKVKITKIVRTTPNLVCLATPLEDDLSFFDCFSHPEYIQLKNLLEEWIHKNLEQGILKEELLNGLNSPEQVINHLSLLMVSCREKRQLLLETLSLHDRFEMIGLMLKSHFKQVDSKSVADDPQITVEILRNFFSKTFNQLIPMN